MTIEAGTYISDLNASYPEGTADRSTADDHLRLIKSFVKASFPNITGAVSVTHAQINLLAGLTDTLTTVLGRYSLSISALNARVDTLSASVSLVQAELAAHSLSISALNAQIAALDAAFSLSSSAFAADIAKLSLSVSAINTELAAHSLSISAINTRINTLSASVSLIDSVAVKYNATKNLEVGYTVTPYNRATLSTTWTLNPTLGNVQYAINGGGTATLIPPTADCTMVVQITNNASATVIVTSAFTKVQGSFTNTNGDDFLCYVARVGSFSHLNIVAMQ